MSHASQTNPRCFIKHFSIQKHILFGCFDVLELKLKKLKKKEVN